MDKLDFEIIRKESELIVEHFSLSNYDLITDTKFPRLIFLSIPFGSFFFDLTKTEDNHIVIRNSSVADIEEYSTQEQKFINELEEKIRNIFKDYLKKRAEVEHKMLSKKVKVSDNSDEVKKRLWVNYF